MARYRCLSCGFVWQHDQSAGPPTGCALCGHVYLDWQNYEGDFHPSKDPRERAKGAAGEG